MNQVCSFLNYYNSSKRRSQNLQGEPNNLKCAPERMPHTVYGIKYNGLRYAFWVANAPYVNESQPRPFETSTFYFIDPIFTKKNACFIFCLLNFSSIIFLMFWLYDSISRKFWIRFFWNFFSKLGQILFKIRFFRVC